MSPELGWQSKNPAMFLPLYPTAHRLHAPVPIVLHYLLKWVLGIWTQVFFVCFLFFKTDQTGLTQRPTYICLPSSGTKRCMCTPRLPLRMEISLSVCLSVSSLPYPEPSFCLPCLPSYVFSLDFVSHSVPTGVNVWASHRPPWNAEQRGQWGEHASLDAPRKEEC